MLEYILIEKGGPGSGFTREAGHVGRPGVRGGSAKGNGGGVPRTGGTGDEEVSGVVISGHMAAIPGVPIEKKNKDLMGSLQDGYIAGKVGQTKLAQVAETYGLLAAEDSWRVSLPKLRKTQDKLLAERERLRKAVGEDGQSEMPESDRRRGEARLAVVDQAYEKITAVVGQRERGEAEGGVKINTDEEMRRQIRKPYMAEVLFERATGLPVMSKEWERIATENARTFGLLSNGRDTAVTSGALMVFVRDTKAPVVPGLAGWATKDLLQSGRGKDEGETVLNLSLDQPEEVFDRAGKPSAIGVKSQLDTDAVLRQTKRAKRDEKMLIEHDSDGTIWATRGMYEDGMLKNKGERVKIGKGEPVEGGRQMLVRASYLGAVVTAMGGGDKVTLTLSDESSHGRASQLRVETTDGQYERKALLLGIRGELREE